MVSRCPFFYSWQQAVLSPENKSNAVNLLSDIGFVEQNNTTSENDRISFFDQLKDSATYRHTAIMACIQSSKEHSAIKKDGGFDWAQHFKKASDEISQCLSTSNALDNALFRLEEISPRLSKEYLSTAPELLEYLPSLSVTHTSDSLRISDSVLGVSLETTNPKLTSLSEDCLFENETLLSEISSQLSASIENESILSPS
jgi:hypothetical protein